MNVFRNVLTVAVIALLLFLPVLCICFAISEGVVRDPDAGWHLRTAEWIVAHGAVPRFDSFAAPPPVEPAAGGGQGDLPQPAVPAQTGTVASEHGAPWVDYSWAAQLVLGGLYRIFGLRGLVIYSVLLTFSIILAFFVLVRRMQQNLLFGAALTIVLTAGMLPLETPRPWLFSILFFVIELHILLEAGRTARPRLLLLLVPLFWVWANVHIQFTLGLLVLAAAVVEPLLARRFPLVLDAESAAISPRWLALVFLLCCGATLLNPYHVRLYVTAVQLLGQTELWNVISELKAIEFRYFANWAVLAAALAGAAAIAARRPLRLLLVLLFPLALYSSFRSGRDVWFVLIVGLALAASMSRGLPLAPTRLTARSRWGAAAVVAVLTVGSLWTLDESRLEAKVAEYYPAQAVAFLRQGSYEGPLYNTYAWGGYLIFHYPEHPVNIDGRTLIHGAARIVKLSDIEHGRQDGWQSDPELAAARLLIFPRKKPITLLLRLDARFKVAYEDDVAVVFVRR